MLTYDDAPEVRALAEKHGLRVAEVPMKSTHHAVVNELLIMKEAAPAPVVVAKKRRPAYVHKVNGVEATA
jgi:hypothetical protein